MVRIESTDTVLASVIDYVNGTDREINVTVALSGMLVSGRMVSGHRFMKHVMDKIVIDQPYSSEIKDEENKNLEIYFGALKRKYMDATKYFGEAGFIHLLDAKFHNGSGKDLGRRPAHFWRGDLEQVVGFYFD
ncbi:hypothetical protein [Dyadobacter sp. 676]|uniref:Uncharacterized protein n=1 Tax=Dyadobacter sp. 676 TaxID=3088362 RepID=A0AAU8FQ37_9BACT